MADWFVDDDGCAQADGDSEGLYPGDSERERLHWRKSYGIGKDDCVCGTDVAKMGGGSVWYLRVDFDAYEVCLYHYQCGHV